MRLVLAALAGSLAGAAAAQVQPSFPASFERGPIEAWLARETDIQPESVVAVTPQALTSIVSRFPGGGGQEPRVVIRAEALSADTYARTGALSWHVSLSLDCAGRRVRLGETTGYPQRNLLGERRILRVADADWRTPERGTALEAAWRAVCDPAFSGPLKGATASTAEPLPPPQQSPPRAPATPPPASKPRAASHLVAQVGAARSETEARGLLVGLGPAAAGRPSWIERAEVGGRTWHRAVVGGFADGPEAQKFCAALRSRGRACFVRSGRPPN